MKKTSSRTALALSVCLFATNALAAPARPTIGRPSTLSDALHRLGHQAWDATRPVRTRLGKGRVNPTNQDPPPHCYDRSHCPIGG